MNSTRLPGKVLKILGTKPVLGHVAQRVAFSKLIDQVIVATSTEKTDDPIAEYCVQNKIKFHRGKLNDVLDRYYHAAIANDADYIVRVTADCPLIDGRLIDKVIEGCLRGNYDWYSLGGDFPDGFDCQIFKMATLKMAWENALLSYEREHVGPYIEVNNREKFNVGHLEVFEGVSHLRLTLDYEEDYRLLAEIFDRLDVERNLTSAEEIIKFSLLNDSLLEVNSKFIRNESFLIDQEKGS